MSKIIAIVYYIEKSENYNINEFVQLFNQSKNLDVSNLSKLVEEYDKLKRIMIPIKKKVNKNKPDDQKPKKKEKSLKKVMNVDRLQNELIKIASKLNTLAGNENNENEETE